MTGDTRCVRVRIEGRVQGVYFRAWTVSTARDLGLDGWVRNRSDGTVEAVFRGSADQVDRILAACRNGPPNARVTQMINEPADAEDAGGTGFRQRRTL